MTEGSVIYNRSFNVQPLFSPLLPISAFTSPHWQSGAYNFPFAVCHAGPQTRDRFRDTAMSSVRAPAVAGAFYPATTAPLQAQIAELLAAARPPTQRRPKALIAP